MREKIRRLIIEDIRPQMDGGTFPIRRAMGEAVQVKAAIIVDGHDLLAAELLYRIKEQQNWRTRPMLPLGNDFWHSTFRVNETATYQYTVRAWIDRFGTWVDGVQKKYAAGHTLSVEMMEGAYIIEKASQIAGQEDRDSLLAKARFLKSEERARDKMEVVTDPEFMHLMGGYPDKSSMSEYEKILEVVVEPLRARFSAWYEMFPRSCSDAESGHGTFKDCVRRLPYIADMGFDVLYLPPIHPIGMTHRKGKNNAIKAGPEDPGSPWAIGSAEGGHRSVHPDLGTMEDFKELVREAQNREIEVALPQPLPPGEGRKPTVIQWKLPPPLWGRVGVRVYVARQSTMSRNSLAELPSESPLSSRSKANGIFFDCTEQP